MHNMCIYIYMSRCYLIAQDLLDVGVCVCASILYPVTYYVSAEDSRSLQAALLRYLL